ncbi:MAG: hypothetical protein WC527_03470 [Candidatus Margulisiibacteriota bacterium]
MTKPLKTAVVQNNGKGKSANHQIVIGVGSFILLAVGVILLIFGINLSSDRSYFESIAGFLTDLRPTPAMLGKLDYKIDALSSISKQVGVVLAVLSFIVLYLTLKGVDVLSWQTKRIKVFIGYLGGKNGVSKFLYILGSSVLILIFSILFITTVGFFFGITVSKLHFLAAVSIVIVFVWLLSRSFFSDKAPKIFLLSLALIGLAAGFSLYISANVYDTAFDSQAYHQESMIYMAQGWNPIYSSRSGDIKVLKVDEQVYLTSKASETCAATIYKLTGNIEAGKLFNFLLIFASFCLALSAILSFEFVSSKWACFLSFFLAFNPVSAYQSLSYYVDGQMSSIMICSFSLFVIYVSRRGLSNLLMLGVSLAILLSIKLTGLVYALLIYAGAASYEMFSGRIKDFTKLTVVSAAFMLLSFFCFSFNPFITNHINHGHIFYPFYGKSAITVVNHGPAYIVGMNAFQKTISSVFSESENFYVGRLAEPAYKFPLFVSPKEMAVFANTDTRVGGFGPLFGAILICSFAMLAICLISEYRFAVYGAAFVVFVMFTVFIIPEGWWARFVPQFYIVPFPVLVLSCYCNRKAVIYLRRFIAVLLVANLFLVAFPYYLNQAITTRSLSMQLKEMKSLNTKLAVYMPFFSTSMGRRLNNAGIKFIEEDKDYFVREPKMMAADFSVIYYSEKK